MVVVASIGAFDLILLSGPLLVPNALALSSFDSANMGSVLDPCNPTQKARENTRLTGLVSP